MVDYQNGEHDIELCTSITVRQCIVLFHNPFLFCNRSVEVSIFILTFYLMKLFPNCMRKWVSAFSNVGMGAHSTLSYSNFMFLGQTKANYLKVVLPKCSYIYIPHVKYL